MRSSNPVLGRLVDRSAQHAAYQRVPAGEPYAAPGFGYSPSSPSYQVPVQTDRMTVDDVVVRTVTLLAVVGLVGATAWVVIPRGSILTPVALFGALGVGLILGLVIAFRQITNPALILTYAAVEGVLLGLISRYYAERFDSSIIVQAVTATFAVFFGMAALYKFRIIRVTRTFVKWVMGAVIGVVALMLVNFLLALANVGGGTGLGLRDGSDLAIGFSLLVIGIAALTFALDFRAIEDGVQMGVERRYAWYASFGILVGLIWLYLEILRLIGYSRD